MDVQWVQVLSEGWATPLTGFMTERQYLQSQHFNCLLSDGLVNQSVPVVLALSTNDKQRLDGSAAVSLTFDGRHVATLRCPEFYQHRKEERCSRQFGTCNIGHPYVKVAHY